MLLLKWILNNKYIRLILLSFLCAVSFNANSVNDIQSSVEGKILHKQGHVQIHDIISNKWVQAKPGSPVHSGDTIKTGANGKAHLLMSDETIMQIGQSSELKIHHVAKNAGWFGQSAIAKSIKSASRSVFSLISGKLWARNKNKNIRTDFNTTTATIGIRGTELVIEAGEDGSVSSTVVEGMVEASNEYGSIIGEAGNQISIKPGQVPSKSILLNPEDAVQWTLVIPSLIRIEDFSTKKISVDILQLLQVEDYAAASIAVNKQLARDAYNKHLQLLDAALDIFNNEPKRARNKLNKLAPNMIDSALLSRALATTNILLGDKDAAKKAAAHAVRIETELATNHIVMAYVEQACFDLESAMQSIKAALRIEPDNIQAIVMLAQLQFGSGAVEQSMATLLNAHNKNPKNADINNLAGFVLLAQRKLDDAKNAFKIAIQNNASAAESHMGLALIYMREGNTEQALEEITTAVALDPQRSLFLSYWGKMLYQIKRFDKALDMFDHAALLDKNDPTPVFYKSIILSDLNRPGEAIEALNKAVALNDNRAVYRSRFLLDQDLAVRNVDLSILYNQLGLSRTAERKAVAAIKSDYSNYSGHLFYYGALSAYDDRSYPAGSEALLARMLMPANVNTFNTFNDYTTFFEQPEIGGQLTARGGNFGTIGGDLIIYGSAPESDFAYNVGIFSDKTDGWRETNSEETKSAAFIGKWQASDDNGFLLSTIFSEYHQKDRGEQRYEFDSLSDTEDELNLEMTAFELGYNYRVSPTSHFLVYATHQNNSGDFVQSNLTLVAPPALYTDDEVMGEFERPYSQLQMQYMSKSTNHQLITGLLGFTGSTKQENGFNDVNAVDWGTQPPTILDPLTLFDVAIPSHELDISFFSVYIQDNWQVREDFIIEAAIYFDKMENANAFTNTTWEIKETSPRLGMIWNATTRNTFRLSAFQYVLPFVSSRLDPVDVAGVPIFRNTEEGAIIKEANLVWEYETDDGIFSIGAFNMEKEVPDSTGVTEGSMSGADVYFETLFNPSTGLNLSYRYQTIEDLNNVTLNRDDHLFAISIRHQRANGVSMGIKDTYRNMNFEDNRDSPYIRTLDLDIAYEFDNKAGKIALEVKNALDAEFNWVTDRFVLESRNPAREFLLTATVNF
ncbi:MAG: FecR domain-containing protein [Gammaproteobacteria bacterium]|nr:FecR domain-containing protein [Gammaproteobacteria bacterium]